MSEAKDDELETEVRGLRYRLSSLREEVDLSRIRTRAVTAALLALASLAVPTYEDPDALDLTSDTAVTLWELVNKAENADNGTVNLFAVITILSMVGTIIWCGVAISSRIRLVAIIGYALGGLAIAMWVVLVVVVLASGEGTIDELGYVSRIATLLVPISAGFTLATARAVHSVTR